MLTDSLDDQSDDTDSKTNHVNTEAHSEDNYIGKDCLVSLNNQIGSLDNQIRRVDS